MIPRARIARVSWWRRLLAWAWSGPIRVETDFGATLEIEVPP
jgi:hypothetical protein